MIQFTLKCSNDHRFDSWFHSSEAYDRLEKSGLVTCTVCGGTSITKAVMAPRVRPARDAAQASNTPSQTPQQGQLTTPATNAEQALAKLKAHIESTADYVGRDFAREARAMHDGTSPDRAIYGEAAPEDARRLIEDGVPIAPLPFLPRRKSN
jgi:hypothetical protein